MHIELPPIEMVIRGCCGTTVALMGWEAGSEQFSE